MSQPPPPPQQPPGGFGPQDPYGYPQQPGQAPPPGQPGYGYPPTPQPGYGYPPGQPPQAGGFASPGQRYAAMPTQAAMPMMPPMGGPPPQPPPGGGKKVLLVAIVAAAVAMVLVIGGGAWLLTHSDADDEAGGGTSGASEGGTGESGTEPTDARLAWKTAAPRVKAKDILTDAHGTWFSGRNIVKALPSGVVAYDRETGEEAWSLDLPRPKSCGVAYEASGDKTAITFGQRCENIAAIDIAAGKEIWRDALPSESDSVYEFADPTIGISGDVVALNWGDNGFGYRLSDGSPIWQGESTGECRLDGYTGGKQLLARFRCHSDESEVLQGLTPKGTRDWEWRVPKGVGVEQVFSQAPLTLGVSAGDSGVTDVMVVRDGKLTQKIAIDQERYDLFCSGRVLSGCAAAVVHDNTLYLGTKMHEGTGEYERTNEIIAFDLGSGKPKWQVGPTEQGQIVPVSMAGDQLIAYQKADYSKAGKVVVVHPGRKKAVPRMNLPESDKKLERDVSFTSNTTPYWRDGHFFLVTERFYSRSTLSLYAILAYR